MESSLERIVPDRTPAGEVTGSKTLQMHLERYRYAAGFIRGGLVVDAACGVGYGSHLLARQTGAVRVIGVDIDAEAIQYARDHYDFANVEFLCADLLQLRLPDQADAVVSLETIEHLPQPERFIEHVARLLKPGGVFVCSVPVTPSLDGNPYHLRDFSRRSVRRMVQRFGFTEADCMSQVQPYSPFGILTENEDRLKGVRGGALTYYARHPFYVFTRLWAVLRFGFTNRYETIVWKRAG